MKKFIIAFSMFLLSILFATCSTTMNPPIPVETPAETPDAHPIEIDSDKTEAPTLPFDGKIAIITNSRAGNDEEYDSAQILVEKYSSDKVIHVTWPDNFMVEQARMIDIVAKLGTDPDVKAIITNQSLSGTIAAIEKLRETRKDIFVVCIASQENPAEITIRANMVLAMDEFSMGPAMVQQAQKLGAATFVHYSIPRHMSQPPFASRRDLIKETCTELGIQFVDATAIDPTSKVGIPGAQQFILDDVPKTVAKYGTNTAFFATNCAMQVSLIEAVVETGAIYPQPCCPSPYHGFPIALGIDTVRSEWDDKISRWVNFNIPTENVIAQTRAALAERNMLGRVSTWPKRSVYLLTVTGAEYAIKWINGEVPQEGVDVEVLQQLMEEYAGVEVHLTPYTDEYPYTNQGTGETYENFLLMRMDYITY